MELESKPVSVEDGLAKTFPGDALPSSLQRGPTPATPSFKVTRVAVPIASTTAGANAESAALAEVTMKLSGWRQRSYPIRITVEGKEVYRGQTPRSLGYVTLSMKRVRGKTVKVELLDAASARDGFNITELENQQNAATGDERQGSGTLSIVEFECYASAPAGS